MEEEIVYILINPCMKGLVKIGKSTSSGLKQRLKDLSRPSGIPLPFVPYYAAVVKNAKFVESKLHKAFENHRISLKREFFELDPSHAQAALELASIREVILTNDNEDEDEVQKYMDKQPSFQFSFARVPIGAELKFARDESILCTVIDEKTVEFEGKKTSLSDSAGKILTTKFGWSSPKVQGPAFWTFENETLAERRKRLTENI
jgi:hypothetical protein